MNRYRANHEVVFRVDGETHVIEPGKEVELSARERDQFPQEAFSLVEAVLEDADADAYLEDVTRAAEQEDAADATLVGVADDTGAVTALVDMKKDELLEIAKDMEIKGATAMNKAELIAAIEAEKVAPDTGADTGADAGSLV